MEPLSESSGLAEKEEAEAKKLLRQSQALLSEKDFLDEEDDSFAALIKNRNKKSSKPAKKNSQLTGSIPSEKYGLIFSWLSRVDWC